jgi:hypothetical protein
VDEVEERRGAPCLVRLQMSDEVPAGNACRTSSLLVGGLLDPVLADILDTSADRLIDSICR